MTFIEKCTELYNTYLYVGWIEEFDWSKAPDEKFREAFPILDSFAKEFFISFSKSILNGEYIYDENKVKENLAKLELATAHEYDAIDPTRYNTLKHRLYEEYKNTDRWIRTCIVHYEGLFNMVIDKIDMHEHDYMFNALSRIDQPQKNHTFSGIVRFVIPIARMDHILPYDKESISNLILMRKELEDSGFKVEDNDYGLIYHALFEKCSYLLKRILLFRGKSEFCLDFKSYSMENKDIDIEFLSKLNSSFEFLHTDNIDKETIRRLQEKCFNQEIHPSEIILLMKYYKKHGGQLKQIDNLISQFDNRIYTPLFKKYKNVRFNKYALNTIKNYLYNSRFSFKTKLRDYTYNKLLEDMEVIEQIQSETYIRNYYPYRKAVIFLIEDISKDLKKATIQSTVFNDKIEHLQSYINKLEDNLKWCNNINFYPFQLIFHECLALDKKLKTRIFIPSSFARPIGYENLQEEIIGYKNSINTFTSKKEYIEEKNNIEFLKKEIFSLERKYMEILGVFMTVSAFLFGTIDFLSQGNGKDVLITSVLAFGVLLLLFNSSLYFITIPREQTWTDYLKHPRLYFFAVTTALYLIILIKTCLTGL